MATVLIPKGRSVYYAKFQHKGKSYFLSTGKASKKEAAAWMADKLNEVKGRGSLHELFDRVLAMVGKIPGEKERNDTRQELVKRLLHGKADRVPVSKAWSLFEQTPRKKSQGDSWRQISKSWWGKFEEWLAEHHPEVKHLDEVTPVIAQAYARHLNSDGTTGNAYNRRVRTLALVFKTLKTDAGLTENVWSEVNRRDTVKEGQRPLTDDEVKLVLSKAHEQGEPALMLWLLLGVYTGLRLKDVVTLTWENIDFDKRVIHRVAAKTRKHTNGTAIHIPMAAPLEAALKAYRNTAAPDDVYLFLEYAKDYGTGGRDRVETIIKSHYELCEIQTLREKSEHRKKRSTEVGFHSLRHTFVTLCADRKVPLHDVQAMVGHMTPEMTTTYTHSSLDGRRRAVKALPDLTPNKRSHRKLVAKVVR